MTFIVNYDRNSEEQCQENLKFLAELGAGQRVMIRESYQRWGGPPSFRRDARRGVLTRATIRRTPKETDSYTLTLPVEIDRWIRGHDCGGRCKNGFGWWISPYNLNVIMDACGSFKGILEREKNRIKDQKKLEDHIAKYGRY